MNQNRKRGRETRGEPGRTLQTWPCRATAESGGDEGTRRGCGGCCQLLGEELLARVKGGGPRGVRSTAPGYRKRQEGRCGGAQRSEIRDVSWLSLAEPKPTSFRFPFHPPLPPPPPSPSPYIAPFAPSPPSSTQPWPQSFPPPTTDLHTAFSSTVRPPFHLTATSLLFPILSPQIHLFPPRPPRPPLTSPPTLITIPRAAQPPQVARDD